MRKALFVLALLLPTSALAQQSASFTLDEHAFNCGGHPEGGNVVASASFRVTLGAIGEDPAGRSPSSALFSMGAGFCNAYPPPGEVTGLIFVDHENLEWHAEPSAGTYNLYRDWISNLVGLGYGECRREGLTTPGFTDAEALPTGRGFFYLVTAENRLTEEGVKGVDSAGVERRGTVCP